MRAFLFQQKRTRKGKVVTSKTWSCEIQLDDDPMPKRQSLRTTDKRVAQKRMDEIVAREQQERAGLLIPESLTNAATKSLQKHAMDFIEDLIATDRVGEYTRHIKSRLNRLFKEIGWNLPKDMNSDAFIEWRKQYKAEPRTKNHYLDTLNAFCNWMKGNKRIEANPFEHVKRVSIPKGSTGNHRSLSAAEIRRLLTVAPDRAALYLVAVVTGLRDIELRRLRWEHVYFEQLPYLKLPPDLTKNRRGDIAWLTPEAAHLLHEMNPDGEAKGRVFKSMPSHHTFNNHLEQAGIPKHDHLGRSASFHTLRRSLVTLMHKEGVDRRTAMAVARHAHSQLTDVIYADTEALPKREAVMRLPEFLNDDTARTEMRTDDLDAIRHSRSAGVAGTNYINDTQSTENKASRHNKTDLVVPRQNSFKNGAGGNRTPVPG